jgi:hypothetical protein
MRRHAYLILACVLAVLPQSVCAQRGEKWVVSWTGSAQGPYPIGNPSAQPDQKFAFPTPDTGARDQTFRPIVRPDLWGQQVVALADRRSGLTATDWRQTRGYQHF